MQNYDPSVPVHLGRNCYTVFGKKFSFPSPSDPMHPSLKDKLKEQARQACQDWAIAVQENVARMKGTTRDKLSARELLFGIPTAEKKPTDIPSMRAEEGPKTNPHTARLATLEATYARAPSDRAKQAARISQAKIAESQWNARAAFAEAQKQRDEDPEVVRARACAADQLERERVSPTATAESIASAIERKRLIDGPGGEPGSKPGEFFHSLKLPVQDETGAPVVPRTMLEPLLEE